MWGKRVRRAKRGMKCQRRFQELKGQILKRKTEETMTETQIFKKYFWSAYPFTVSEKTK